MSHDDIVHPDNVVLGLNYLIGKAIAQGSKRAAPILANAIAEIERLRAANAAMLAACEAVAGWKPLRADALPALRKIIRDQVLPAIALATGQEEARS